MKAVHLRIALRGSSFLLSLLVLVMLAFVVAPAPTVRAASVTVDSPTDATHSPGCATNGTSPCSLRDAITYANANPGVAVSVSAGTYNLTAGILFVHVDMTITGAGADTTIIDGGGASRIFLINGGNVSISQLTMRNGNAIGNVGGDDGGALVTYSSAVVTLGNVIISGNTAAHGGGVATNSSENLTINDSAITGNSVSESGGGVYNKTGAVTVNRSLINHNTATGTSGASGGGGGIYVLSTTTLNNTTVFDNTGPHGGGVANGGNSLVLSNATISGNSASQGNAIFTQGSVTITNSIIAGSCFNTGGSFSSGDYNIDQSGTCGVHRSHDQIVDPTLDGLKNNGGPTQTLALLSGSPAIDKIPNVGANCPATDQRGVLRPQPAGGACDIGAFEAAPIPAPTHFVIGSPPSATAGAPASITVTAKDAGENTVLSYTGAIHFSSSDSQAIVPTNYVFTGGGGDNGMHTFTDGATFKSVGNQTLTVTDAATPSITGNAAITVNPATAARFVVNGFASPNVAGAAGSVTVTAIDAFGNTATGYAGTVHFSSSDPQADLPSNYPFTGGDAGVHTFTNGATLRTAGTQSIVATDSVTSSITGSQSITITSVGGIASFVVTGYPSPTPVNTANGFTVIAKDAYGNTVSAYRGGVQFSSTDGAATLPGTYTFTAADSGVHLFSAVMKTVGNQTLTVADTTNGSVTGNQALTVTAAAANHLFANIGTTPQSVVIGRAFPTALAVTVQDSFNNPVSGILVTFAAPGNGPRGFFGGSNATASVNTDSSGVATAPIFTAGSVAGSYTVAVTVSGIGTSTPFTLTNLPDSVNRFVLMGAASAQAGAVFSFSATATDSAGNIATGYRGTVHLASNDPQASLPSGDYTFTDTDNGVHSFSVMLRSAGSRSATVMDIGPASASGSLSITIMAASASTISANASSTPQIATIGATFGAPFAVTAVDAFGNPVNGLSVTFIAPGDGASGSFAGGGNPTALTGGSGVATAPGFTANSITGGYSVFASATGLSGVVFSLTNSAGPPGSAAATAGSTQSATVNVTFGTALSATVKDGANNPAPNIVVTFIAPGGGASGTFIGNTSAVNVTTDANGVATAPAFRANTTAGSYAVSASAPGVGSPATFSLTNNPGAANVLVISPLTNPTQAGAAANFTVTARDTFGNTATGYSGTVHFASTDPQAAKPVDYPFVAADFGSHAFAATFKSIGPQVLTASDSGNNITGNQPTQIIPGPAATITVTGYPSPVAVSSNTAFTVSIRDAFGNTASGYLGTVKFTSTDTQAALPANYSFTAADQGTHSFAATFKTVGTQTLTATDTTPSAITGSQSGIRVTSGAGTHLTVSAPATAKAGTSFSVTVTARDALENAVTDYTRTVRFASSDPLAGLPPDYTFVAADNGAHVFTVLLKTAGSRTVTATDLSVSTVTGNVTVAVTGPIITGVSPLSGPFGSGTAITVTGINLTGASVTIGGNTCTGVVVNGGGTSLTCNAPSHAAGTVEVTVTTSGGSATLNSAFTYVPASLPPAPPSRTGGGGTGGPPDPAPAHR